MLAVIACVASCFLVLVLGFYGYVFMQLYREYQRFEAQEKHLAEHLCAIRLNPEIRAGRAKKAKLPKLPGHIRKETLIHVGVALGGLLGVFAEIDFLNRVVSAFH
jgi:hypothetical protein